MRKIENQLGKQSSNSLNKGDGDEKMYSYTR